MNFLSNAFAAATNTANQVFKSVNTLFTDAQDIFSNITSVVSDTISNITTSIVGSFATISLVGTAIANNIINNAKIIIGETTSIFKSIYEGGKDVVDSFKTNFDDIKNGGDVMKNIGEIFGDLVKTGEIVFSNTTASAEVIAKSFQDAFSVLSQGGSMITTNLSATIETVLADLEYAYGSLEYDFSDLIDVIVENTKDATQAIKDGAQEIAEDLNGFFNQFKNMDFTDLVSNVSAKNYNEKRSTLRLSLEDVLSVAEDDVFVLNGDKGDKIDLKISSREFTQTGKEDGYVIYSHKDFTFYVDQDIAVI